MKSILRVKDLVTVGVFTSVYTVTLYACAMLGVIPVMFILLPLYSSVLCGIPFMLFLSKVERFGMVTIMSFIVGSLMFLTGHTFLPVITSIVFGLLADLALKAGRYRSFKFSALSYVFFSLWMIGALLPLWVMRDSYMQYIKDSMGEDYMRSVEALTPIWVIYSMIGMSVVGSLIGAFVGRKALKKHFIRAGIV
jgi:energy-coupling factor transport system substrate-specific component